MRKAANSVFFAGLIAVTAILLSSGIASAVTEVTNVSTNADFQNGNIIVDASIACENTGDFVVFEAMQTQGRHIGVAVFEYTCAAVGTVVGPFTIPVFDGLTFRSGPFTLLAKIYNESGVFQNGQGFQLKGK